MTTGAYRDTLPKYLRDVDKRLGRLERRRLVSGGGGGAGGDVTEVQVGGSQPTDPNVLLWYNTANDTLYVNDSGTWTPVSGGVADAIDEVFVGVNQPSDPTGLPPSLELWYDPDATIAPLGQGFTFVQGVAASVWVIDHPLPFQPNVTVTDSAGDQVEGTVEYTDADTITIRFTAAFAGTAYLS